MSVALTGKDTHLVGTRILTDLGDGDVGNLDFPNNLVEMKTGKNGNTIYAFNATGKVVDYTVRTILGSDDDKYFNAEMNRYLNDPPSYTLLDGEFIKRVGDGSGPGGVSNIIYRMSGGIPKKMPNTKENVEGDTEQAIAEWAVMYANTDRSIT